VLYYSLAVCAGVACIYTSSRSVDYAGFYRQEKSFIWKVQKILLVKIMCVIFFQAMPIKWINQAISTCYFGLEKKYHFLSSCDCYPVKQIQTFFSLSFWQGEKKLFWKLFPTSSCQSEIVWSNANQIDQPITANGRGPPDA